MSTNVENSTSVQHDAKLPVTCWVAVEDSLPVKWQWLLVFSKKSGRHMAWFTGDRWDDRAEYTIQEVTHWMFIPEPPCT